MNTLHNLEQVGDLQLISLSTPQVIGTINLHTQRVTPNSEHPIRFKCKITAHCCDRLEIQLSDLDIYRIETLGYELDQFIEDTSPRIKIPQNPQEKPVKYYILKKREFDRRCVFLEDNLCKIHALKPHSCKLFPFSYRTVSDNEISVAMHPANICSGIEKSNIQNSENEKLLKELLVIQMKEINERKRYEQEFLSSSMKK